MNAAQLIAKYIPTVSDVDCCLNFNIDMTASMVLIENEAGRLAMVPAMKREAGQRDSQRMLLRITKVKPTVEDKAAAKQARLDAMAAAYANDASFELPIDDYVTFATGLAKACHTHDVDPSFLLDDDGEL